MGRISEALSGAEARNEPLENELYRPYRQSFNYDGMGHLTGRTSAIWNNHQSISNSYVENRRPGWSYDADGNLLQGPGVPYTYDAAGQIREVGSFEPIGTTTRHLDGDGRQTRTVAVMFNETSETWETTTRFFLRSSLLDGQVLTEIEPDGANGTKRRTFVYAGGSVLAWQQKFPNAEWVVWEHNDPSGASFRTTNVAGYEGGSTPEESAAELDPTGGNAGPAPPLSVEPPPEQGNGSLLPYPQFSNPRNPGISYSVDGIPVTSDFFLSESQIGFLVGSPTDAILAEARASRGRLLGYSVGDMHFAIGDLRRARSAARELGYPLVRHWLVVSRWSFAALLTPQNPNAINYGPITQADFDLAGPLSEKNYDRCKALFSAGDWETPGVGSANLALAAAKNNADDAAMIGAIWMHESGPSGGINATEYWGDAGPAQLTFSGVRDNRTLGPLVVGDAYGNYRGRTSQKKGDPPWRGSEQDNLATLRNIVRFGRLEYGSNWWTAYWYGPGYPQAPRSAKAKQNRKNYANNITRIYRKYLEFFKCLTGT